MEQTLQKISDKIEALGKRLESIEGKLGAAPCSAAISEVSSALKQEFDDIVSLQLPQILALSDFSPILVEQTKVFADIAKDVSNFIGMASQSQKPLQDELVKLLEPISKKMAIVSEYKDKHRADKFFNNIAGVSELVASFGWIAVEPKPVPFIADVIPSGEFYTNRVLMAFKGKDQKQCDWAKAIIQFVRDMQAYVKQHHTTGLMWSKIGAVAKPTASAPASVDAPKPAAAKPAADVKNALFASLNKGDLTAKLSHVRDEEKNKNMSDDQKKALAAKVQPKAPTQSARAAQKPKGDPLFKLLGTKWMVENQYQSPNLAIDEPERNHAVFATGNMHSGLAVKDKVNIISIDNCIKCNFMVENVVSSVEIVNSRDIKLQINGNAPAINIDKCDGVQVFLTPECAKNVQIITAKSSAICISVQGATPDDDPTEFAIPEQFLSAFKDGKLNTAQVSHV